MIGMEHQKGTGGVIILGGRKASCVIYFYPKWGHSCYPVACSASYLHRSLLLVRLSPPERRYADVLGLSDWPRYPDGGLAEPKGNKLHDLR